MTTHLVCCALRSTLAPSSPSSSALRSRICAATSENRECNELLSSNLDDVGDQVRQLLVHLDLLCILLDFGLERFRLMGEPVAQHTHSRDEREGTISVVVSANRDSPIQLRAHNFDVVLQHPCSRRQLLRIHASPDFSLVRTPHILFFQSRTGSSRCGRHRRRLKTNVTQREQAQSNLFRFWPIPGIGAFCRG